VAECRSLSNREIHSEEGGGTGGKEKNGEEKEGKKKPQKKPSSFSILADPTLEKKGSRVKNVKKKQNPA